MVGIKDFRKVGFAFYKGFYKSIVDPRGDNLLAV